MPYSLNQTLEHRYNKPKRKRRDRFSLFLNEPEQHNPQGRNACALPHLPESHQPVGAQRFRPSPLRPHPPILPHSPKTRHDRVK